MKKIAFFFRFLNFQSSKVLSFLVFLSKTIFSELRIWFCFTKNIFISISYQGVEQFEKLEKMKKIAFFLRFLNFQSSKFLSFLVFCQNKFFFWTTNLLLFYQKNFGNPILNLKRRKLIMLTFNNEPPPTREKTLGALNNLDTFTNPKY